MSDSPEPEVEPEVPPEGAPPAGAPRRRFAIPPGVRNFMGKTGTRMAGAAGIAALVGLVVAKKRKERETEILTQQALAEVRKAQRDRVLAQMAGESKRASLQQSIQMNLARIQQSEPALYAQIQAGRRLPQGAVVIGGEPRNDLLQELGRSMAEGQFNQ